MTPAGNKALTIRIRHALTGRLHFDPEDDQALQIWDTTEMFEFFDTFILAFKIFLGFMGVLTLIVGGIGVANIMFAVVKEKTREIGVQMALGGRGRWITGSIVLQGLSYTILGGLLGSSIAAILITVLDLIPVEGNQALEFLGKPTLSWSIAVSTAALLGIIGTLAGYFPARRAATIDPAQTLRYE